MKKILMTLAAILCCAMISTVFTACDNSDNESVSDYAAYTVNPDGVFSNSNCMTIVEEMRTALKRNMVGKMRGSTETESCICNRNDNNAISICDEVFNKATPSGHFSIVLLVTPFGNGSNNKTTTLKTYKN